ncbi:hypothetical protein A2J04_15175 [Rhodococcus sp. EPR-279]|nr:hypothetical protein A2J02_12475 [Rhodococcus sp. EPR-147]KZE98972.1 hypothetical protein A2J04_15175 [Rhodococcus sp. EPR-279]
MSLADKRVLVQMVAAEQGHTVVTAIERGQDVDLIVSQQVLGADRTLLIRLASEPITRAALDEGFDAARLSRCSSQVLVGEVDLGWEPNDYESLFLIDMQALVDLLESSALVKWVNNRPTSDADLYGFFRKNAADLTVVDPTGLRWLRALSLNKLPPELRNSGTDAETMFEEAFFRISTRLLGLAGRRLGTQRRGVREPDGYLVNAQNPTEMLLYDCKAARDGFEMTAAEERKLLEYCGRQWAWHGRISESNIMIVCSSSFLDSERSYNARRTRFLEAGTDLVYLSSQALFALAIPLAVDADGPEATGFLSIKSLSSEGKVTVENAAGLARDALQKAKEARRIDECGG